MSWADYLPLIVAAIVYAVIREALYQWRKRRRGP